MTFTTEYTDKIVNDLSNGISNISYKSEYMDDVLQWIKQINNYSTVTLHSINIFTDMDAADFKYYSCAVIIEKHEIY